MSNQSGKIHDYRILNFAIIDILGTILIAYIFYKYKIVKLPLFNTIIVFILFGILVHYTFSVDTTLNYYLCLSEKPKRFRESPIFFEKVSL